MLENIAQELPPTPLVLVHPKQKEAARVIPDGKFFIIKDNCYNYYAIDIKDPNNNEELEILARECKKIEDACWKPQEEFCEYLKKSDTLVLVGKDGEIVGFALTSLFTFDEYALLSMDEVMIKKAHRRKHMGRSISALAARHFYLKIASRKEIRKAVFAGESSNPAVIRGLYKYKLMFSDHSFRPSINLLRLHDAWLARKGYSLVHKDSPFFIKNLFPGSLKANKHFKMSKKLKESLPPGFDYLHRGDSLLFMGAVPRPLAWTIITFFMLERFGRKFWFNEKIGLMGKNSYKA